MSFLAAGPSATRSVQHRALFKEVVLVAASAFAYSILCTVAPVTPRTAFAHARQILRIENFLGFDIEVAANTWLQNHSLIADLCSIYYSLSFFTFTFGTLLLLWFKRPERYLLARNVLFVMTGAAMITYWTYPLAPPRLLAGEGFVDSVATQSSLGAGYAQLYSQFGNPYAAMPSMHTGWSVWVAACLGLFVWTKGWQRLLLALHPLVTIFIIITTGNHYILDAIGGIAYFSLALSAVSFAVSLQQDGLLPTSSQKAPHSTARSR